MRKKLDIWILGIALVIGVLALNMLSSKYNTRLDLTEDSKYSLASSTKSILKDLKDIVTIRLYFSGDLPPQLLAVERDVDDLVSEFKSYGGNNIQIENINPSASAFDEQQAVLAGIPPVELSVIKHDRQEVAKVFLGIAVLYGDKTDIIPFVSTSGNLEYQLTQSIIKVTSDELPVLGWWVREDQNSAYNLVKRDLTQRYTLSEIKKPIDLVDGKFSAILVIAPTKWTKEEQLAFDQYLMNDGKAFVMVNRFKIGEPLSAKEIEVSVVDMLKSYGIDIQSNMVIDKSSAMASFTANNMTYHIPYPYWVMVRRNGIANKQFLAGLETVVMPWTSSLKISENVNALLLSSNLSQAMTPPLDLNPNKAGELVDIAENTSVSVLGAEIDGEIKSFFAGKKGMIVKEKGNSNLVVIGDANFASDFFLQQYPQNLALFANIVDNLAMGDLLIGIRSRGQNMRPIAVLSDAGKSFLRYANVIIGPIFILILGGIVLLVRKASRKKALREI